MKIKSSWKGENRPFPIPEAQAQDTCSFLSEAQTQDSLSCLSEALEGNGCIRLRPHHLLCTQSYRGIGYNEAFKEHMDDLVARLRTEKKTRITLVFSTDELCSRCPNMLGTDLCKTNQKVKALDTRTAECFHLEARSYIYQEIVKEIRQTATPEILDHICHDCSWYEGSSCRELILKNIINEPAVGCTATHPAIMETDLKRYDK